MGIFVVDGKRYIQTKGGDLEIANTTFCPYCGSHVIYHDAKRVSCSLYDCPLSKHKYSLNEFTSKKFKEAVEYFQRNKDYLKSVGVV